MFKENIAPKMIPDIVAKKPIVKPVKKKISLLVLFKPKVLKLLSLWFFFN